MMHCMVNRRFAPARRRASSGSACKDSSDGRFDTHGSTGPIPVVGFLAELPEILCRDGSPFHGMAFCERIRSQRCRGEMKKVEDGVGIPQQLQVFSQLSLRDTETQAVAKDPQETSAGASVGPMQRLYLWGSGRARPYERRSNMRRPRIVGRSQVQCRDSAVGFSVLDNPRNGSIAWFSVEHGPAHPDVASGLARLGSHLSGREAEVWEGFAPLQRVLVVAVAAAAAAAAKERSVEEMNSLQQAIECKEESLALLRQELRELWDKVLSDKTTAVADGEQATETVCETADQRVNSDLVLESCVPTFDSSKTTGRLKRQSSRGWDNPLFGDIMLDVEDPTEWLSVHSSVTSLDSFYGSPLRFPRITSGNSYPTVGKDTSRLWQVPTRTSEGLEAGREAAQAKCASVILGIRKQITALLEKEASGVMSAFTAVIDKAKEFQKYERGTQAGTEAQASGGVRAKVLVALKESVEHATGRVTSLQTAVIDMCQKLGVEALASLDIFPSDIEKSSVSLKDGIKNAACQGSTSSWQEWLTTPGWESQGAGVSYLQPAESGGQNQRFQGLPAEPNDQRLSSHSDLSEPLGVYDQNMSPWKAGGVDVTSALRAAVSKAVDNIIAPLDGGKQPPGFLPSSPEFVAEQLLADLEVAASKVAGMEAQMSSMKAYIRSSEKKRREAEVKLAEAIEADKKNQAKANLELVELTKQLRLKEEDYEDVSRSRKAEQLLLSEKSTEIQHLREELESLTMASKVAREANDQRFAALEEICRRKDANIFCLNQEISSLEKKVNELLALTMPSPQRVRRSPSFPAERTGRSSLRFSLESSFSAVGETCDGKDSRSKATTSLEASSGDASPPKATLTESKILGNVIQVPTKEHSGGRTRKSNLLPDILQGKEGRSKTGTVMQTSNHGESRMKGHLLFTDENYLSLITGGGTPRAPRCIPELKATPTTPSQKRGAAFDKDADQKTVSKNIKENADKRRRWL